MCFITAYQSRRETIMFTLSVCLFVCPQTWSCSTHHSFNPIVRTLHIHVGCGVLIVQDYFQNFRSKVKVVGHRKVKNVFLVISRRRIVVESRDWWEESYFKCTTYIHGICGLRDCNPWDCSCLEIVALPSCAISNIYHAVVRPINQWLMHREEFTFVLPHALYCLKSSFLIVAQMTILGHLVITEEQWPL